jgi:DNA-binding Lrp family transcriptional regulator
MLQQNSLDRIDAKILATLQKNARLSNKELAAVIGLAPSSCLQRVRRMRAAGILRGFHAEINPGALGIGLEAMVAVRLRRHSRKMYRTFGTHLLSIKEAVAHYNLAGSHDVLVHVTVRDTAHLYDLLLDSFTTRPEVDRLQTYLIYESVRRPFLPDLRGNLDADVRKAPRRQTNRATRANFQGLPTRRLSRRARASN